MLHTIPVDALGPQGEAMAKAVETCVHCGFCLASCPTYRVLGEEMDSPRGRIFLMKEALEGQIETTEALPFIDRCLGCMACVTACPSGVEYGHLLTPFRARAEKMRRRPFLSQTVRTLIRETLPYPQRFRLAVQSGRLGRRMRSLLPAPIGAMLDLLPERLPEAPPLPELYPAQGRRRARVALLAGCVQQVLAPEINWATLRVLARNGVETIIPRGQGCCGSLSMHIGEAAHARALARRNYKVFPTDVDAVLTNAAGCGSGMHEYGLLFAGEPDAEYAEAFGNRVCDVSVFLDELGVETPPPLPQPLTAAYHDACHLAHAQRVTAPPRRLLSRIANLHLVEIPEGELCCGSAGTYNLEQPKLARAIGERKARNILSTKAEAVITGNIGCIAQIKKHLELLGRPLPLWHTVQALDWAYRGRPLGSDGSV
ncbi:MAG: heterodisulfide reductase-related iron-sulfur binding cluster [Caldilinea sp.]|nr:heterodisulfide reductase-related iron-sulfur binding cluster [Caldilinea sp.]MDW8441964.1 heterodisulfide reductase-related iron-sulfur binding cluster [Caldilineaceae bacterium]